MGTHAHVQCRAIRLWVLFHFDLPRLRFPLLSPLFSMASDFHSHQPSLEPFPLFIDSAPPNSANYFSSPMAMAAIQILSTSSSSYSRKPRISMPSKLSSYLRLRYYQYEVTFGLYMLTPTEKLVFNAVVLGVFAAFSYALFWGFEPFIVNLLCRFIYYLTGSFSTAPELCSH